MSFYIILLSSIRTLGKRIWSWYFYFLYVWNRKNKREHNPCFFHELGGTMLLKSWSKSGLNWHGRKTGQKTLLENYCKKGQSPEDTESRNKNRVKWLRWLLQWLVRVRNEWRCERERVKISSKVGRYFL